MGRASNQTIGHKEVKQISRVYETMEDTATRNLRDQLFGNFRHAALGCRGGAAGVRHSGGVVTEKRGN